MNTVIRGDKIVVTDAIKDYINKRISKLDKFFDDEANLEAKIVIKVRGVEQRVESTIHTPSLTLRAEESHADLYAAVDLVVDKLERQISKNKSKLKSKKNKEKYDIFNEFDFIEDVEIEESNIVKRKELDLKPMDEEEAILQMELLNHSFFVFKNIDTETICVLYKRKDNHYGLIDTKE